MADPSNNDSVPAGGNFWPPSPASGNDDSLQFGGPESWATPWDYSVNGPLLYGPLSQEAKIYGLPDFARAARYYAAARDAADPDGSFGAGAGQVAIASDQAPAPPSPPTPGSPEFAAALNQFSGLGDNARRAFIETQRWEGDTPDLGDPGNPALAGLSQANWRNLRKSSGLSELSPDILGLTPENWALAYVANANDVLQHIGGHDALESLPFGVAANLHDTLVRSGVPEGVPMIKQAINAGLDAQNKMGIDQDNPILGRQTLDAPNSAVATPEGNAAFFTTLKNLRDVKHTHDINRNQYFYNLGMQSE